MFPAHNRRTQQRNMVSKIKGTTAVMTLKMFSIFENIDVQYCSFLVLLGQHRLNIECTTFLEFYFNTDIKLLFTKEIANSDDYYLLLSINRSKFCDF